MKTFMRLFFLLALLCACTPKAEQNTNIQTINCSPNQLEIPADGGRFTVHISASDQFAIYSNDSWVANIEPPYVFEKEGDISIRFTKNSEFKSRNGVVYVKCGDTVCEIPVTQLGLELPDPGDMRVPEGYTLIWHDEFDYEGLPNASDWKYQTGDGGWGNNELQDYVAGSYKNQNIADVKDGVLKIYAKKIDGKVRSCRLNTRKSWTYGYIEASLKLPKGKGTWPAFWMMPSNFTGWPKDGELDIMEEVGYNANYCSATIHCNKYNNGGTPIEHAERYIPTAQSEFHVYAMEWTPEFITFYQDHKPILTYKNEGRGYDYWPFDAPFYVILNLAWGGNWGGAQGIDESCLPCALEVDYVRVFQKQ